MDSPVYEMHYKTIFHYTYYLVGKKELAEDITQNTFIKAYKKINMLETYEGQRTWLYKIACNLVNAHFRRAKMNRILDANNAKKPAATVYEPESWLKLDGEDYALYKAVGQLSLNARQAIVLRNIEGFSTQQCTEILKWNESRVENTTILGMKKLQELIEETQEESDRLQTIKKMGVSEEQVTRGKEDLQRTLIAQKNKILAILVCLTIYAILLFFLFVPLQIKEFPQQVPSTTEIDNVILLYNHKPELKLDLHSIHYLNKLSFSDEDRTLQVMDMLPAILSNPVEWDVEIDDEFSVYDMQVTYSDGVSVYYKVDIDSPSTLIDVENQIRYIIPKEIDGDFHSFIWTNLNEHNTVNRFQGIALIVIFSIIPIINWCYRKKYAIRDEGNKEKTLNGWLSFIGGVVFLFSIGYSPYFIGAVHAGFVAINFLAYVFIKSRLETYFEVMKPNAVFYRYIFPVYVVVVFTMILIVI